ncbi:MAG: hypothetical protein QMD22_00855 [archaeon]|nr:hypothetical protein [archaeon]
MERLARLTVHHGQIATLRLYTSSYVESKLNSSEIRKLWDNRGIPERFRRYFGDDDAKFAKVAAVEWSKHPTLFITADYTFFRRMREKIPRLRAEHIEKDSLSFKSVIER